MEVWMDCETDCLLAPHYRRVADAVKWDWDAKRRLEQALLAVADEAHPVTTVGDADAVVSALAGDADCPTRVLRRLEGLFSEFAA